LSLERAPCPEKKTEKKTAVFFSRSKFRLSLLQSFFLRRLGNACVLAVPAEYAGASSGSGDHPQQYYLRRPDLTIFEEKDFSLIFFIEKYILP